MSWLTFPKTQPTEQPRHPRLVNDNHHNFPQHVMSRRQHWSTWLQVKPNTHVQQGPPWPALWSMSTNPHSSQHWTHMATTPCARKPCLDQQGQHDSISYKIIWCSVHLESVSELIECYVKISRHFVSIGDHFIIQRSAGSKPSNSHTYHIWSSLL